MAIDTLESLRRERDELAKRVKQLDELAATAAQHQIWERDRYRASLENCALDIQKTNAELRAQVAELRQKLREGVARGD